MKTISETISENLWKGLKISVFGLVWHDVHDGDGDGDGDDYSDNNEKDEGLA